MLWGGIPVGALAGLDMGGTIRLWTLPVFIAIAAVLLLALTLSRRRSATVACIAPLLGGALCTAGLLALFYAGQRDGDFLIVVLSGSSTGFGYGMLLIGWENQLTAYSELSVAKILTGSLIVSSVLYFATQWITAGVALLFVSAGLALASSFLLGMRRKNLRPLSGGMRFGSAGVKVVAKELREPIVCVSALAAIVSLTRYVAISSVPNPTLFNFATHGSALVVGMVLYAFLCFLRGREGIDLEQGVISLIYRVAFPIMATLLLFASAFGYYANIVAAVAAFVMFLVISVCTMFSSQTIARKHQVWPPLVYGLIAGSMYGSFALVASLRDLWIYPAVKSGGTSFTIIVILAFYILAMAFFVLQSRSERAKGTASPAVDDDPVVVVVEETAFRCELLAKEHKLTQREQEVMLLIARGRDVPGIAQQLFISSNTVRSHSKNIYKKLGIHSKAELLDLLDDLPSEDAR